jgi:2-polyprenyl-3-methyl-5-hydroxy-6-metoxy-1,4-benzoquinol methylase
MYSVQSCPICSGSSFQNFGQAKDYTVSHETFQLQKCKSCDFLFTTPRPKDEHLGKYYLSPDYVSHTAKAITLFDKLYEASREFALNWKLTLVKKFLKPPTHRPTLLDYGCGTGFFLKKMNENGFNIAGVELSEIARATAERNAGIKIQQTIKEIESKFDVITLWHVLEHISNLNELIIDLKDKMNEDATLIIAVPNYQSNDAKKYGMQWAGYDVPRHLWHFEQKTMSELLAKHHLKVVETIPMKLDAFYVSMLSEKYKSGKQSLLTFTKGLLNGWISNLKAKQKNYSSIIYIARQA